MTCIDRNCDGDFITFLANIGRTLLEQRFPQPINGLLPSFYTSRLAYNLSLIRTGERSPQ
ncbi:hypothetical protein PanWU01x14_044240 [Parasponia andersonii]|uniref:Uncharacterized protein n=1 Tax=Parasponia andersonii TaxID=3476 RepID=A0A2P5DP57_PARAD|nr:hypothetical protein PanWU01x14_044240 [Parasponia andersonii]